MRRRQQRAAMVAAICREWSEAQTALSRLWPGPFDGRAEERKRLKTIIESCKRRVVEVGGPHWYRLDDPPWADYRQLPLWEVAS